jgi:hypothetical protein
MSLRSVRWKSWRLKRKSNGDGDKKSDSDYRLTFMADGV